jgi:hypothetical protein
MLRRSLLITVGVALALGLIFLYGPWSSDRLVFYPATKVCQLTGEFDKQRNQPTRNYGQLFGQARVLDLSIDEKGLNAWIERFSSDPLQAARAWVEQYKVRHRKDREY